MSSKISAEAQVERNNLNKALIKAILFSAVIALHEMKPEKTGKFSFDSFIWDECKPILKLAGDHGTPDFTLTFLDGGRVLVSPDSNPSWAKIVESTYDHFGKLAKDIIATMLVVSVVGV